MKGCHYNLPVAPRAQGSGDHPGEVGKLSTEPQGVAGLIPGAQGVCQVRGTSSNPGCVSFGGKWDIGMC